MIRSKFLFFLIMISSSGFAFTQGATVVVEGNYVTSDGVSMTIDTYNMLYGAGGSGGNRAADQAVARECNDAGGGGVSSPSEEIRIIWQEERGGFSVPGGYVEGCSPLTLSLSKTHSRATTWSIGGSYYVTAAYGVQETVTITQSASFPLPANKCGYISAKEALTYSEYDLYRYGQYVGPGYIIYLKGIKFATGLF